MPSLFSHMLISGPPPCTRTGRTPTHASNTRSLMTPAYGCLWLSIAAKVLVIGVYGMRAVNTFKVGSFIAAPPYLMTITLFLNCCRYGKASDRTETFSNADKFGGACKELLLIFVLCTCVYTRCSRPPLLFSDPYRRISQEFGHCGRALYFLHGSSCRKST